jgi:hypothetical protein
MANIDVAVGEILVFLLSRAALPRKFEDFDG